MKGSGIVYVYLDDSVRVLVMDVGPAVAVVGDDVVVGDREVHGGLAVEEEVVRDVRAVVARQDRRDLGRREGGSRCLGRREGGGKKGRLEEEDEREATALWKEKAEMCRCVSTSMLSSLSGRSKPRTAVSVPCRPSAT